MFTERPSWLIKMNRRAVNRRKQHNLRTCCPTLGSLPPGHTRWLSVDSHICILRAACLPKQTGKLTKCGWAQIAGYVVRCMSHDRMCDACFDACFPLPWRVLGSMLNEWVSVM